MFKNVITYALGIIVAVAAMVAFLFYYGNRSETKVDESVIVIDSVPAITVNDRIMDHAIEVYEARMHQVWLEIPENVLPDLIEKVGATASTIEYAEEYEKQFEYWSQLSISRSIGDIAIDLNLKKRLNLDSIQVSTKRAPAEDSTISLTPNIIQ